ncbi:MAG: hypothetical protein ACP5M9_00770 [Candidatus Micrarchaeia archaeon]
MTDTFVVSVAQESNGKSSYDDKKRRGTPQNTINTKIFNLPIYYK